jgi:hypothetical protein
MILAYLKYYKLKATPGVKTISLAEVKTCIDSSHKRYIVIHVENPHKPMHYVNFTINEKCHDLTYKSVVYAVSM